MVRSLGFGVKGKTKTLTCGLSSLVAGYCNRSLICYGRIPIIELVSENNVGN